MAEASALALVISNATSVKTFKGYVALVEVKAFEVVKMMARSILISGISLRGHYGTQFRRPDSSRIASRRNTYRFS